MTKTEMATRLAQETGINKRQAHHVLEYFSMMIRSEVLTNGECRVFGLGTFKLVDRAARIGRNPQTGEAIDIPAKQAIKFKTGATLKKELS